MNTCENLDALLTSLMRGIGGLTGRSASSKEYPDITENELRVIRAIGVDAPQNMSAIAKKLSVTVGTLTISMNSLVKKGYVNRERGQTDHRVVYISLSEKGKEVYLRYEQFRYSLIHSAMDALTTEEVETLIKSLEKLNNWVYSYSVIQ